VLYEINSTNSNTVIVLLNLLMHVNLYSQTSYLECSNYMHFLTCQTKWILVRNTSADVRPSIQALAIVLTAVIKHGIMHVDINFMID
jgi:hypothetical protein